MTSHTSIYIHVPFCKHRCAYCDFNTYANQESLIPEYVEALVKEIHFVGEQRKDLSVHTIFFGGGTPSLLSPAQFDSVLNALAKSFGFTADIEISTEANPGTVSLENLRALRKTGLNRISYGVQSANMEELRMLERAHNFFDVIEAVSNSRKAGFDNLNLDLIYGLPEQTLASWKNTLARIVDLHPEHISAYALTLEHGTPFGRWSSRGLLPVPDPDLAAEMYEHTEDFLAQNKYDHYEISNWAKRQGGKSLECRHNVQYWRSLPYLAFGAGGHGYANGYRYSNVLRIKTYIERLQAENKTPLDFPFSPATVNRHKQTEQDDIADYMINNLRLLNLGAAEEDFRLRFDRALIEMYPKELEDLIHAGLLERVNTSEEAISSDVYRLTKRGRLLGNRVFMRFV